MASPITIKICHLYPDLMDTYGDRGNILALQVRCNKRGINTELHSLTIGNELKKNVFDIFFFGGGQDRQQMIVAKDLRAKSSVLKQEIENGKVLLSVCGGYQLLLDYFIAANGETIKGIGLFRGYTQASSERMIGNLVITLTENISSEIKKIYSHTKSQPSTDILVGFENHSGKTFVNGQKPLGNVIIGYGNNGEDNTEGITYKNAFGCYLHGSLLPKNPHFADFLIYKALKNRHLKIKLNALDDSIEWEAHRAAIKRSRSPS